MKEGLIAFLVALAGLYLLAQTETGRRLFFEIRPPQGTIQA